MGSVSVSNEERLGLRKKKVTLFWNILFRFQERAWVQHLLQPAVWYGFLGLELCGVFGARKNEQSKARAVCQRCRPI